MTIFVIGDSHKRMFRFDNKDFDDRPKEVLYKRYQTSFGNSNHPCQEKLNSL